MVVEVIPQCVDKVDRVVLRLLTDMSGIQYCKTKIILIVIPLNTAICVIIMTTTTVVNSSHKSARDCVIKSLVECTLNSVLVEFSFSNNRDTMISSNCQTAKTYQM